jgi:lipopolysaccharide export system protein LptC
MNAKINTEEKKIHDTDWLVPSARQIPVATLSRYSRFVGSLKLLLPISAACILLVLVVIPNINGSNAEPKKATAPVYTNRDAQNRPYTITADEARQQPNAPSVTDLANPKATIDLGNGTMIDVNAKAAQYDQSKGTLGIETGLTVRRSDGTTFTTDEAHVDVNGKNAEGNKPVLLQGNFGEVRGQGFKTMDGGKTIIFTGESSATLKMGKGNIMGGLPSTPQPAQNPKTSSDFMSSHKKK